MVNPARSSAILHMYWRHLGRWIPTMGAVFYMGKMVVKTMGIFVVHEFETNSVGSGSGMATTCYNFRKQSNIIQHSDTLIIAPAHHGAPNKQLELVIHSSSAPTQQTFEEGGNGRAECLAENVNRFERMSWTLPSCRPILGSVGMGWDGLDFGWKSWKKWRNQPINM